MLVMRFWRKKAQATSLTVDRQRQVDIGYVARQLGEGDLSFIKGCSTDSSVRLILNDISLMAPRQTHTISDSGIREKIAKGLYSFYIAQQQAEEYVQVLDEVDRGTMTITVEGIMFAGKSRHVGLGFSVIESISHGRNGIAIMTRNGAQGLHFEGAERVTIPLKVQDRAYSQPLSGKLMRLLLEAVIRISFEGRGKS